MTFDSSAICVNKSVHTHRQQRSANGQTSIFCRYSAWVSA